MAESLSIGGVSLNKPGAWRIRDLAPLLDMAVRGDDVRIPGVDGVVAVQRRIDVLVVSLELMIFGRVNYAGTPNADVRQGVYANIDYLNEQVVEPTTGDGTRAAVLTFPDGTTTYGADVHVLPPLSLGSLANGYVKAVLRLSVPSGRFLAISP